MDVIIIAAPILGFTTGVGLTAWMLIRRASGRHARAQEAASRR